MANDVEIIIKTVDETSKTVKQIASNIEAMSEKVEQGGGAASILQKSWTELNSAFAIAQKSLEYLKQAYAATIVPAVQLAEQVRDLGRITGMSTDETSRLIQVADDLKVEYGTLKLAARSLASDGLTPNIETLAQLSDKFLSFNNVAERNEWAAKNIGRSWQELSKILEAGGGAIRKMADEQQGALILTEEQVKTARQYEIALDGMNDAMSAAAINLGNVMMPAMIELVNTATWGIEQLDLFVSILGQIGFISNLVHGKINAQIEANTEAVDGARLAAIRKAEIDNLVLTEAEKLLLATGEQNTALYEADRAYARATSGATGYQRAETRLTQAIRNDAVASQVAQRQKEILGVANLNYIDALGEEKKALEAVNAAVSGNLKRSYAGYSSQMEALKAQHVELSAEVEKLTKWGYSPLSDKLQDAKRALYDNEAAQGQLTAAAQQATAALIFEQAATVLDADAQLELAKKMGLVSQVDYDRVKILQQLKDAREKGIITEDDYTTAVLNLNAAVQDGNISLAEKDRILKAIKDRMDALDGQVFDTTLNVHVNGGSGIGLTQEEQDYINRGGSGQYPVNPTTPKTKPPIVTPKPRQGVTGGADMGVTVINVYGQQAAKVLSNTLSAERAARVNAPMGG